MPYRMRGSSNNILGQYRQQVLARLEAASRRGAPQSEVRRLQAELRAIEAATPAGGVPVPPTPTAPPMPGVTPTPSPTGTRLPAFATGAGGVPGVGKQPIPWSPGALPGGAGGGGGLPSWYPTDPYEQMLLPAWLKYASQEEQAAWIAGQAGMPGQVGQMTEYQSAELARRKAEDAWNRMQDMRAMGAAGRGTWAQKQAAGLGQQQFGLSQEKFGWQQQQDVLAQQLARQRLGVSQQQVGLQERGLEQAWMIAQQQLIQSQREMAAAIGRQLVSTRGQTWAQGLPYELPRGTQFAPGFGQGGPASRLAKMGGAQFTPMRIAPSPAPNPQQLMTLVQQAMQQFGPGG